MVVLQARVLKIQNSSILYHYTLYPQSKSNDAIPTRKRRQVGVRSWRTQTSLFWKIGDYALCCKFQIIENLKTFNC